MSIKASKTFKSIQRASIYSKKLKSIKKLDYIDTFLIYLERLRIKLRLFQLISKFLMISRAAFIDFVKSDHIFVLKIRLKSDMITKNFEIWLRVHSII